MWAVYVDRLAAISDPLAWLDPPAVMGVVNITPDSFSDGGRYVDVSSAIARVRQLAEEGAGIVDLGAESTRPGAERISADDQLGRLLPVIDGLSNPLPLSIDTTRAAVADAALRRGATLINDVSAGREDPELLSVVAAHKADLCLMHMQGAPATMQLAPRYGDVVQEVRSFLKERVDAAVAAGVDARRILIDPGIGFGKTLEHNLALLEGLAELASLGHPVLVGVSRKSMFGAMLGREVDDRLVPSVAAGLGALARGASIIRVHDVADTVDAISVWRAIQGEP
jgi:dihydropteroate synthase